MNIPVNHHPRRVVAQQVSGKARVSGGPLYGLLGFTPLGSRWGELEGVFVRSCGCGHGPGEVLVVLDNEEYMLAHVNCIAQRPVAP